MKTNYLLIAAGAAVAWCLLRRKAQQTSGMTDTPVSLDNIRRGVQNGWYTAELTRVDGAAAIRLSGKTNDGKQYTDVYPISESDYNTLIAEGYETA